VLVGVRDAESRTRFLGYRPEYVKLFAFVVSAMMAGIAGALYVPQVGIINPGEFDAGQFHRGRHLDGGRRARHADRPDHRRHSRQRRQERIFTAAFPEFWLFALGGLFVLVTLFLPKGIVGTARQFASGARNTASARGRQKTARTFAAATVAEPQAAE
jgi:urea transport system permease protein